MKKSTPNKKSTLVVGNIRLHTPTDARRCAREVNQNLATPIDSRALFARRDLPQFQTSYQQVARLRGRPVALGGSLKHRFGRWKTLVSARRANKVVPVRTKCRYIFYTRYRQHLQPAIELSFALFSSPSPSRARSTTVLSLHLSSSSLPSLPRSPSISLSRRVFCQLLVCGLRSEFFVAHLKSYILLNSSCADKYRTLLLSYTREKCRSKHSGEGCKNF